MYQSQNGLNKWNLYTPACLVNLEYFSPGYMSSANNVLAKVILQFLNLKSKITGLHALQSIEVKPRENRYVRCSDYGISDRG